MKKSALNLPLLISAAVTQAVSKMITTIAKRVESVTRRGNCANATLVASARAISPPARRDGVAKSCSTSSRYAVAMISV